MDGAVKQRAPVVLRQRPFLLLWLGGVISQGGDWVLTIALPVYVYDLTHSTLATGALVVAQALPRLLLGLVAGVLVDRWDRRRTAIGATLGQGALLLLLLPVRSPNALPLVYAIAAGVTTLALLVEPAVAALVPRLVDEGEVLAANGLRALGWEFARLAAPPLGGLLMATAGLSGVALVDSASFAVSAALLALIGRHATTAAIDTGDTARVRTLRATLRHDLSIGVRAVVHDRLLVALLAVGGLTMGAEGIINVLGFPWIAIVLRGGATERGWLATAQGVGGIAGGLTLRTLRRTTPGRVIGVGAVLFGVLSLTLTNIALMPIDAGDRWPLALVLKALSGAPLVVLAVSLDTLLVRSVDDRVRGRVLAAYGAAGGCALLVGQVLASVLGDRLGVVAVLSLQGVLYMIAGGAALTLIPSSRSARPTADHAAIATPTCRTDG